MCALENVTNAACYCHQLQGTLLAPVREMVLLEVQGEFFKAHFLCRGDKDRICGL